MYNCLFQRRYCLEGLLVVQTVQQVTIGRFALVKTHPLFLISEVSEVAPEHVAPDASVDHTQFLN